METKIKDEEIESLVTNFNQNSLSWFPDPYPESPDIRNLVFKVGIILIVVLLGTCLVCSLTKELCKPCCHHFLKTDEYYEDNNYDFWQENLLSKLNERNSKSKIMKVGKKSKNKRLTDDDFKRYESIRFDDL